MSSALKKQEVPRLKKFLQLVVLAGLVLTIIYLHLHARSERFRHAERAAAEQGYKDWTFFRMAGGSRLGRARYSIVCGRVDGRRAIHDRDGIIRFASDRDAVTSHTFRRFCETRYQSRFGA